MTLINCLRCKKQTQTKGEELVQSGDKSRITGTCAICGIGKSKFVKKQTGSGIAERKLSKAAYQNKKNAPKNIEGYELDEELSKKKTRVYHNPETKKTIVAHRGTSDAKDLKDDLLLTAGILNKKTSSRVKTANKVTNEATKKYGDSEITHTGHSLGGRVSELSQKKGQKVETYNGAASPLDVPKNVVNKVKCSVNGNSEECKKLKNRTAYTTGIDPISISNLVNPGKVVIEKPTKLNVHTIDNFVGEGKKKKRGRPKKI